MAETLEITNLRKRVLKKQKWNLILSGVVFPAVGLLTVCIELIVPGGIIIKVNTAGRLL